MFTGDTPAEGPLRVLDERFHRAWLEELAPECAQLVKRMLPCVFPRLAPALGCESLFAAGEDGSRLLGRACDLRSFSAYFLFPGMQLQYPGKALEALVSILQCEPLAREYFASLLPLRRADGTPLVVILIRDLSQSLADDGPIKRPIDLLPLLLAFGDEILSAPSVTPGCFDLGAYYDMKRLVDAILRATPPAQWEPQLPDWVSQAASLCVGLILLEAAAGRQPLEDADVQSRLEQSFLWRIREAATRGDLARVPELGRLLAAWRRLAGEDEPRAWVDSLLSDDDVLVPFLSRRVLETEPRYDRLSRQTIARSLDLADIEPFLDRSRLAERARTLVDQGVKGDTGRIAIDLLRAYVGTEDTVSPVRRI